MYTFYEADKQDAAQESAVKLPASKRKFTSHASFHLTRHPATGTDVLKGKIPPAGGVHVFSADTWLDKEHLGMKDPTLRPGDVDLKETFKKKEDAKDDKDEEPASPLPASDEDSPSAKKGKKGKKKTPVEEPELEPEEGAISPSDSQAVAQAEPDSPKSGKKKGMKNKKTDELGKTMDSLASEDDDSEIDLQKPGKKKAQEKKKALKIVEEANDADNELATPMRKKEKSPKRERTRSPKSPGSRRPGSGDSKDGSKLDIDGMGATMEKTMICWSGMHGGISGTGLRPRWEGNSRLPALVGKPIADDLKTPAYVRSAYRHGTVSVGPPYKFKDHADESVPAWTLAATLDMHIDRADWSRSYHKVMKDRTVTAKLGPQDSIRNLARSVSLPKVAGRPKPKKRPAAAPAPSERAGQVKEAWPETSEEEKELLAQGSISDSATERPGTTDGAPSFQSNAKKEKKEKKSKEKPAAKTDPDAFKKLSASSSPLDSPQASTADETKPAKKGGKDGKDKKQDVEDTQPEASQDEAPSKNKKDKGGKKDKKGEKKEASKDEPKEDAAPKKGKKDKKEKDGKAKEDKGAAQSSGAEEKKAEKGEKAEDGKKEKKDKKDKKEKKEKKKGKKETESYPPEVALTDLEAIKVGKTLQILLDPARVQAACRKAGLSEDADQDRVAACGMRVKVVSMDEVSVCCDVPDVGQVFFGVESLREASIDPFLAKPSVGTWYQPIIRDPEVEAEKQERAAVTSYMVKFYKKNVKPESTQVDKKAKPEERSAAVQVLAGVLRAVAAGGLREASLERWQAIEEAKKIKGAEEAVARVLMEPAKDGEAQLEYSVSIAAALVAAHMKTKEAVKNLPIIPLKATPVGDPEPERRSYLTNSGATKQQVQNFAMSMTASIFRKAGSKKTNSLSPPPARPEKGTTGASAPTQMPSQQGAQRPSSRERQAPGAATTTGSFNRRVRHALPADED